MTVFTISIDSSDTSQWIRHTELYKCTMYIQNDFRLFMYVDWLQTLNNLSTDTHETYYCILCVCTVCLCIFEYVFQPTNSSNTLGYHSITRRLSHSNYVLSTFRFYSSVTRTSSICAYQWRRVNRSRETTICIYTTFHTCTTHKNGSQIVYFVRFL